MILNTYMYLSKGPSKLLRPHAQPRWHSSANTRGSGEGSHTHTHRIQNGGDGELDILVVALNSSGPHDVTRANCTYLTLQLVMDELLENKYGVTSRIG